MNALLSLAAVHGPTVLAVDPAKVKPGWLALVIILLMGLATYLLWRSMNRQLKKVNFDDGGADGKSGAARPPAVRNGADGPRGTPGSDEGPVPDGDGGASRS
jgi:hypothetical protein